MRKRRATLARLGFVSAPARVRTGRRGVMQGVAAGGGGGGGWPNRPRPGVSGFADVGVLNFGTAGGVGGGGGGVVHGAGQGGRGGRRKMCPAPLRIIGHGQTGRPAPRELGRRVPDRLSVPRSATSSRAVVMELIGHIRKLGGGSRRNRRGRHAAAVHVGVQVRIMRHRW